MAASLALRFFPTPNPPMKPNSKSSVISSRLLRLPSPIFSCKLRPLTPRLPPELFLRRRGLLPFPRATKEDAARSSEPSEEEEAEAEARGQSTLPERFRYLTKEVPEQPIRWPWLIAVAFLVYCWRAVLWELSNWKKAAMAIVGFAAYAGKLILALVFHFIGDPITAFIQCIEFSMNFARSIYSSIVASAPVPELTTIIILTSVVLAIAETTVPNSVDEQPYVLSLAGIVGFGAVQGFVPEGLFWLLLIGFFIYLRLIKKRAVVSAALPSVAVLVAVGQPWLRSLALAAYLGLAIFHHSKSPENSGEGKNTAPSSRRVPLPLFLATLSIGIHLAAKWIRYRHLTWMIA